MPTYDYECQSCSNRFEAFQSIKAGPLRKCPACGRLTLRRLIGTGGGIIFRGSGFYQTDYRSKSYRDQAQQEKSAASCDTACPKSDSGTSAKPADKKGAGAKATTS